jgi:hypothetical protein
VDHVELIVLFLLVAVAALTALARRLDVPYPIALVLGGSADRSLRGNSDLAALPLSMEAGARASLGRLPKASFR